MVNEHLNIVFADDEENDRLLFLDALKELKIKTNVHTVNDGIELMNYLNNSNNRLPHLLFLDLNMPKKNGMECLKEIRTNEHLNDIAIAIFSTSLSEKDIEETLINGANVYINKPNSFDALIQVLNKVVMTAYTYQNTFFNKAHFLLRL
ncbi:MAG TPA: response regulator [Chitinophagales bacterium]|nr:response regulator [Chitinophagales bacterium]HRG28423.1 response regulator [Chitinophagales bacterium]HRG86679.1 response regulator [Chitinophagales bacterium]HRH54780.1 response regulator [Chitinophagales bacterium]